VTTISETNTLAAAATGSSTGDFVNPLPRSIQRRREHILLDGEWRFSTDWDDIGLVERWYLGHEFAFRAIWPGSIEDHLEILQDAQLTDRTWQDRIVAWYERTFEVPAHWLERPHQSLQLTFGACGYETRVWLNGRHLRTVDGEEVHYGAYTSFSYELPPEFLSQENRLTVRIAHSLDAEIPRGKQESRVYRRGGIWYQTMSGAVRSVWIEPVERNRMRTRLGVVSEIEDRLVEFQLVVRVNDPGVYTLRLTVKPAGSDDVVAEREYPLPLEAGQKRQRVSLPIPGAGLWSPENPQLYKLDARLIDPDGGLSEIITEFGLRRLEARGHQLYLNNQPLYLDGILYQPGTATFEQMKKHMLAMRALGCNLVRVHIAGVDPRIYTLADQMGMLLWVEVPSPHSSSQVSRANHWGEVMRLLSVIGSHPSIVLWSLYNEDWGAQDIVTSRETREYVARSYDYLRLHEPQLLVVENDGWHHVSEEGRLMSDLLTAHIYTPDLSQWREKLDLLVAGEWSKVTARPLVVGDPYMYVGQVPLVVSEWGGFGFVEYGGPERMDDRYDRIRAFKRELRRRPIGGDVYTQAVSIEQEVNGLIDFKSGELLVPPGALNSADLVE
jgi:beta-galactosidase/beta-glucuronidase